MTGRIENTSFCGRCELEIVVAPSHHLRSGFMWSGQGKGSLFVCLQLHPPKPNPQIRDLCLCGTIRRSEWLYNTIHVLQLVADNVECKCCAGGNYPCQYWTFMLLIECKYTPNAIDMWVVDWVFVIDFWSIFSSLFLFRRLSTRDRTRTRKCVAFCWPTKSCAGEIRRRRRRGTGSLPFVGFVIAFNCGGIPTRRASGK